MKKCIFCRIIRKEVDAEFIYEDNDVVCFLDKNPVSKGHCLIMPKKHCKDIFEIDSKILEKTAKASKEVALKLKTDFGAKGINILHASGKVAQQSVFHFHIHIIPRFPKDSLDMWPKRNN